MQISRRTPHLTGANLVPGVSPPSTLKSAPGFLTAILHRLVAPHLGEPARACGHAAVRAAGNGGWGEAGDPSTTHRSTLQQRRAPKIADRRPLLRQRDRELRKCTQEFLVHRHQLGLELSRQRDELAIVRRTVAVPDEFKYGRRVNVELETFKRAFRLPLKALGLLKGDCCSSHATCQNIPELAAPKNRRRPFRLFFQQGLRSTLDPPYRRPHTQARVIEVAITGLAPDSSSKGRRAEPAIDCRAGCSPTRSRRRRTSALSCRLDASASRDPVGCAAHTARVRREEIGRASCRERVSY